MIGRLTTREFSLTTILKPTLSAMANQLQSRASPAQDFSIARQAMADAVTFYLAHGGPAVARQHVERLAEDMIFYDDNHDAYCEALTRIAEAERQLQRQADERSQQQMQQLLMTMMGAMQPAPEPHEGPDTLRGEVELPPKLSTERAMAMWQRLQQAGYVDEHYQPLRLSRAKSAVLADEMIRLLSNENDKLMGIDDKWRPFEILWNRSNMKADHYHALNQVTIADFRKNIRALLEGRGSCYR